MPLNLDPEWLNLGLDPIVLKSINEMGFKQPTEIQIRSIPSGLMGRDIIGSAQTVINILIF